MQAQRWVGAGFFVLSLAALGYLALHVNQWLRDEQQAPVQDIVISGEYRFIDGQRLEQAIRQALPGSFFTLDVQAAHQVVLTQPWVYKATVRKEWPNRLRVQVMEQVALARWNQDMLLNQYGEAFSAPLPDSLQNLPQLYGPGGSEQTALQGYKAMRQLLASVALQADEVVLSERYAWRIQLSNGVRLTLGRNQFIDRVQRFVDLYPLLSQDPRALSYADLRYDTGVAVGWQNPATGQQES